MYIQKLKDMFEKMVIPKNAALIPVYYHRDLLLYTNEQTTHYDEFLESHIKYYATFLENSNKVAGRMWITTQRPNEPAKKLEVILICEYKDDKIYRVWELTYPDW